MISKNLFILNKILLKLWKGRFFQLMKAPTFWWKYEFITHSYYTPKSTPGLYQTDQEKISSSSSYAATEKKKSISPQRTIAKIRQNDAFFIIWKF